MATLPQARRAMRRIETATMICADGVRLDADVYRPAAPGPHPVLLVRQAYGRRVATALSHPHPWWWTDQGYMVVVQDVRGRGTSAGDYDIFVHEARDGAAAVTWAAALDGSDGQVGMLGFSYQGSAQLLAAAERPAALKAIAPAMFGWDVRDGWAYENGAFRLGSNLGWATQVAAETMRRKGDAAAFAELGRTHRALPLGEAVPALPTYVDRFDGLAHYRRWIEEPATSRYWSDRSPSARIGDLSESCPPALLLSGWYDNQLPGVLDAYDRLAAAGRTVRLVVGPWSHFIWSRRIGEVDFGATADNASGPLLKRWFDRWLKGIGSIDDFAPLALFDLGTRAWRDYARWPAGSFGYTLRGDGQAACDPAAGILTEDASVGSGIEWMVTDPWRPAPAHGGALANPPGPIDRTMTDARPDVLTFTTLPLLQPLTLCGRLHAELYAICDAPSFDISCTLSRIGADGRVHPFGEGHATVTGGSEPARIDLPLRATCFTVQPGERLRLSIAGACFPTYPVNPGTGARAELATAASAIVVTTGVIVDGSSRLRLTTG